VNYYHQAGSNRSSSHGRNSSTRGGRANGRITINLVKNKFYGITSKQTSASASGVGSARQSVQKGVATGAGGAGLSRSTGYVKEAVVESEEEEDNESGVEHTEEKKSFAPSPSKHGTTEPQGSPYGAVEVSDKEMQMRSQLMVSRSLNGEHYEFADVRKWLVQPGASQVETVLLPKAEHYQEKCLNLSL